MNIQTNVAPAVPVPTEVSEAVTKALEVIGDVKRMYWSPANLEAAQAKIGELVNIANTCNISITYNWKLEEEFPVGYGLGVSPITKNDDTRGRVTIGLLVAAIPDPALIAEHDKGNAWIQDALVAKMQNQLNNSVRPRSDGTVAASIPLSVEDFITSSRSQESLALYREYAATFVRALKKAGLSIMTVQILRQMLASAAFAKQQFPHIPEDRWSGLLDLMLAKAAKEEKDPGIMLHWRDTRTEIAVSTATFDLSSLDLDEDEDEENADS